MGDEDFFYFLEDRFVCGGDGFQVGEDGCRLRANPDLIGEGKFTVRADQAVGYA